MSMGAVDIDRIVREVVRRLTESNGFSGRSTGCGELAVQGSVVTLTDLNGRLDGIRRVVVSPQAIVTPSVRDELRDKGIQLLRQTAANDTTSDSVSVTSWQTSFDASLLSKAIRSWGCEAIEKASDSLDWINGQTTMAIVATEKPSLAAWTCNRNANVRAAWVMDQASVQDAIANLNANVLIVDPSRQSEQELLSLVRSFILGEHHANS